MMDRPDDCSPDALAAASREINRDETVNVEIPFDRSADDIRHNRPGNHLREKILDLPDLPGIYMYLDRSGKVIYVGKAKRLKRRVASYFNRIHESPRTNILVRHIADLRFIVVPSEEDALHLENANIKAYQPRYNVLLKDDKSYPWIVVTDEDFPRVFMTREKGLKGKYYGPYSNVSSAKAVLELVRKVYPLRSCRHAITPEAVQRGKFKVCLDYHLGTCQGPCTGMVSREQYGEQIRKVQRILNGETVSIQRLLKEEMERLSSEWKFEEAQAVKEKYELVARYNAKSVVAGAEKMECDIFGYESNGSAAFINYIQLRHGAVVRGLTLEYRLRLHETPEELLSLAIGEIQERFDRKIGLVIVPFLPDVEFEGMELLVPRRGEKLKMLDMARRNAEQYMRDRDKQLEKTDPERKVSELMERMKRDFHLEKEPRHIECFDNSNIQGTNPVSSCVVFRDGKPSKKDYRHFIIKTVEGPDDFASMKEVLHRRYTRMMAEGEPLPDMVVVDGGKGQLSAAVEAFDEMGIRGTVALAGIAKRLEEIYFPGDSLPLYIDKKSPTLRVIQALRDEAHRFGITHHRDRRSKGQVRSRLDAIPGVGEVTKEKLMKHFKTLSRIKSASLEQLAEVVGQAKGKVIREFFAKEGS